MLSIETVEQDLRTALKERNQLAADTLRGLKTRIQNEQTGPNQAGKPLSEAQITALIRSEVKRRKEAAAAFEAAGRTEQADKEQAEAGILSRYLPAQLSDEQVAAKINELVMQHSWTAKDFGAAMGMLKAELGDSADGATIARILKDTLKD
jgi:uncharacterized protein